MVTFLYYINWYQLLKHCNTWYLRLFVNYKIFVNYIIWYLLDIKLTHHASSYRTQGLVVVIDSIDLQRKRNTAKHIRQLNRKYNLVPEYPGITHMSLPKMWLLLTQKWVPNVQIFFQLRCLLFRIQSDYFSSDILHIMYTGHVQYGKVGMNTEEKFDNIPRIRMWTHAKF